MHIESFDRVCLIPTGQDESDRWLYLWPDIVPDPRYESVYISRKESNYTFVGWVDGIKHWFQLDIPAGFKHDGRSAPRLLWSRFRPDGPCRIAAHVHDAANRSRGFRRPEIQVTLFSCTPVGNKLFSATLSRLAVDQLYYYFRVQTSPKDRASAWLEYKALRFFGKKYYGSDMPPNGGLR